MYSLPKEVLLQLVLASDLNSLLTLSSSDKNLNTFLRDKYVLEQLAILHEIPTPVDLVEAKKYKKMTVENRLVEAVERGDVASVSRMFELGATDRDRAMAKAAAGGHKNIVQMMIDLGATNYDWAMASAALEGHKDIVQWMLNLGATFYDWAMILAAKGGHKDIVQMMLDLGATNYDRAMILAAKGGHEDIVQLLKDWKRRH